MSLTTNQNSEVQRRVKSVKCGESFYRRPPRLWDLGQAFEMREPHEQTL